MSSTQRYGWIPDTLDKRDIGYSMPTEIAQALPPAVDLRPRCPPVYDQGRLGSCTANAIAAAVAFEQRKLGVPLMFTPSRLFIYYNERALQGTIDEDTGAPLREGMKAINRVGVCPEDQPENNANWPYDPAQFASRPHSTCFAAAHHVRALRYLRLNRTLKALKTCLAEGSPFVFGITVYPSFEGPEVKQTGVVSLPAAGEHEIGGHAMMATGYDDARRVLIVRNSWGPAWGDQGYCYLPYRYITTRGLARDFWTIRLLSDAPGAVRTETHRATTRQTAPRASAAARKRANP